MVTDYEKVQVRAVINGDKENAQVIFEGTALHGSDLNPYLDENKNSIREKIGSNYEVEDQWYNWDWYGHPIGEDATVNGWTNVYVNCTSEEVVQLVIYRNGNTEKPYQNIVLEPALMEALWKSTLTSMTTIPKKITALVSPILTLMDGTTMAVGMTTKQAIPTTRCPTPLQLMAGQTSSVW